jgi:Flp pilus assembly protein TadB
LAENRKEEVGYNMNDNKEQLDKITSKEEYETSLDTRKLEIRLFWQRSLFFWGFIAAAFIAFSTLYGYYHKGYAILIAGFGVICSLVWTLANRGSKRWQENWESKVDILEKELSSNLFSVVEPLQKKKPKIYMARKYSVSKLVIALSDFILIIWLIIFLFSTLRYIITDFNISFLLPWGAGVFFIFVIGYVVNILINTKSNK